MTLKEIRKSIARNLGMLSSDNETIIEGNITPAGITDEINRVYIEVISQALLSQNSDDFTVEARQNTFRASFVVSNISPTTKILTANSSVFGSADIGAKIQNPTDGNYYTILTYISATQVILEETPANTNWIGDTVYILGNIILMDGDLETAKEILKVQVKYTNVSTTWLTAEKETVNNFNDINNVVNANNGVTLKPKFVVSTIEDGEVMKRCIRIYPNFTNYDGSLKILYTKLPDRLGSEDSQPALNIIGISDTIINAVSAWGNIILNDLNKSQIYEAKFVTNLDTILKNYKPDRTDSIRTRGMFGGNRY
jgi:hypothetical protein